MAAQDLIMPKLGESIMEATILKWLKNVGDPIEQDEAVLEIATDKVDSEVPSPFKGILKEIKFNEGDVVEIGKVIAVIESDVNAAVESVKAPEAPKTENKTESVITAPKNDVAPAVAHEVKLSNADANRFYSPLVLNIARQEGIGMAELEKISGSGANNRVTKKDILAYISNRSAAPAVEEKPQAAEVKVSTPTSTNVASAVKTPTVKMFPGDELMEMDRMRKLIADHMVMSKHTSPHVTSFVEADVTNIVLWRNKMKKEFESRENEKLTFTPIFIDALVRTIKDFPLINVSVDGTNIIKRKSINVGMATATPSGNLIVPVIKNADQLNMIGLTKSVNDLAERARNNKLKPDEIEGGTYTISNVGTFGNVMGTPIINQPQVAIMAVGAIRKKPVVIETEAGDTIGIRHMMFLSHSYDHRIVDGALGGMFVRRMADYLENWDVNRGI